MRNQLFAAIAIVFGSSQMGSAALLFNLTSTGNAQADAGFQAAADFLSSQFTDNVTVNITAGFSALPPGVLGSAGSTQAGYTFTNWKNAINGDVLSADDTTFSSNLPGGSTFDVYINRTSDNPNGAGSTTPYNDNDGGANNQTVRLSNANAKALGLLAANAAGQDATITFSSSFTWDFDHSDGINAGAFDFVGVAIHELMHAMGFISGVDVLDINPPIFNDDQFVFVSGLDFTRVSQAALAAGADIDWTANSLAKDFSIDGGTTTLVSNAWSLGVNNGDGRQASHWKDNLALGIMDPTSEPPGSANVVTALDLQALDVIGWDPVGANAEAVPEPSSLALLLLGSAGFAGYSRRRLRKQLDKSQSA